MNDHPLSDMNSPATSLYLALWSTFFHFPTRCGSPLWPVNDAPKKNWVCPFAAVYHVQLYMYALVPMIWWTHFPYIAVNGRKNERLVAAGGAGPVFARNKPSKSAGLQ